MRSTRSFGWRLLPSQAQGFGRLVGRCRSKQSAQGLTDNAVKITLGPKVRNVIIDKSYGARRTTKNGVTVAKELAQVPAARMFALRQLGASATPVSPKGTCDEQF